MAALSSLSASSLKPRPLHVAVFSSPHSSLRPPPLRILRCRVVYSRVGEKINNKWRREEERRDVLFSFLVVFLFFCLVGSDAFLATPSLLFLFVFFASQVVCCVLSIFPGGNRTITTFGSSFHFGFECVAPPVVKQGITSDLFHSI